MQAESSKFASLLFDQGFQIVIPPRSPASVPEPIRTPSDGILHQYNTKIVTNDPPAPSGGDWVATLPVYVSVSMQNTIRWRSDWF